MSLKQNTFAAVGVAALLAMTGTALAQDVFDRPLGEQRQSARQVEQGTSRHLVSVSKIEGDQRYDVTIRDGEVTAKVNGREVPRDRIRWEDDRVEILDRDGDVLSSFHIAVPRLGIDVEPPRPGARGAPRGRLPLIAPPPAPMAPDAPEAPRVMIGITMSEVPEALLEHLELDPDTAVMVDRAIEGLPAEQAGLRARDIIVEVEGERPVTPISIREAINRKNPGDTVELKVIRRGQEQTLRVKLEAFDGKRLGMRNHAGAEAEEARRGAEEARRMIEERLGRMQPGDIDLDALMGGRLDADQMQRFEDALRGLGAAGRARGGGWPEGLEFFVPMTPRGQHGMTDKLTQLDERMVDLERQMERLADRLDELREAMMERRHERRRE